MSLTPLPVLAVLPLLCIVRNAFSTALVLPGLRHCSVDPGHRDRGKEEKAFGMSHPRVTELGKKQEGQREETSGRVL